MVSQKKRLKDVTHDLDLTTTVRQQKKRYYTNVIAEARARLWDLEGYCPCQHFSMPLIEEGFTTPFAA